MTAFRGRGHIQEIAGVLPKRTHISHARSAKGWMARSAAPWENKRAKRQIKWMALLARNRIHLSVRLRRERNAWRDGAPHPPERAPAAGAERMARRSAPST